MTRMDEERKWDEEPREEVEVNGTLIVMISKSKGPLQRFTEQTVKRIRTNDDDIGVSVLSGRESLR